MEERIETEEKIEAIAVVTRLKILYASQVIIENNQMNFLPSNTNENYFSKFKTTNKLIFTTIIILYALYAIFWYIKNTNITKLISILRERNTLIIQVIKVLLIHIAFLISESKWYSDHIQDKPFRPTILSLCYPLVYSILSIMIIQPKNNTKALVDILLNAIVLSIIMNFMKQELLEYYIMHNFINRTLIVLITTFMLNPDVIAISPLSSLFNKSSIICASTNTILVVLCSKVIIPTTVEKIDINILISLCTENAQAILGFMILSALPQKKILNNNIFMQLLNAICWFMYFAVYVLCKEYLYSDIELTQELILVFAMTLIFNPNNIWYIYQNLLKLDEINYRQIIKNAIFRCGFLILFAAIKIFSKKVRSIYNDQVITIINNTIFIFMMLIPVFLYKCFDGILDAIVFLSILSISNINQYFLELLIEFIKMTFIISLFYAFHIFENKLKSNTQRLVVRFILQLALPGIFIYLNTANQMFVYLKIINLDMYDFTTIFTIYELNSEIIYVPQLQKIQNSYWNYKITFYKPLDFTDENDKKRDHNRLIAQRAQIIPTDKEVTIKDMDTSNEFENIKILKYIIETKTVVVYDKSQISPEIQSLTTKLRCNDIDILIRKDGNVISSVCRAPEIDGTKYLHIPNQESTDKISTDKFIQKALESATNNTIFSRKIYDIDLNQDRQNQLSIDIDKTSK